MLRYSLISTDIPFVRAREDVQYNFYLTKLLSRPLDPVITPDVGETSSVSMNEFVSSRPFDNFLFIDEHNHWRMDHYL